MQIISMETLRNTAEISAMCNKFNEPIFIMKEGIEDLVIMSKKTYEDRFVITDIVNTVRLAEQEVENGGQLLDGRKVLSELRAKYVK
ncbi:MAG: hypothetical protein LBN20_05130 [Endomicrobium sp.]|jgi:PHD/YefM family antitoxin component YafN of YafNO toxin-antitoxin module|nr:hypothetical protein [Endomicrobium sp.]